MDSDQNRPHDSAARIRGFDLSVEVLLQSFQDSFPKGTLMGAPIGRVLPVDEGEIGLTVRVGVGKSKLDGVADLVNRSVQTTVLDFPGQQIQQSVSAEKDLFFEMERKSSIEKGVVPESILQKLALEPVFGEDLLVRAELDPGAGPLG